MLLCEYVKYIRNEYQTEAAHKLDLACKGANYQPGSSLMVIGRAPNHGDIDESQNLFRSLNKPETLVEKALTEQRGFASLHEYLTDCEYNPRRSQFWNLASRVVRASTDADLTFKQAIESLAWSNLYKIAPMGKNPSWAMQQLHGNQDWVSRLLLADIEAFKPKALLFMTDTGAGWFDPKWLEGGFKKGELKGRDGGVPLPYLSGLFKGTTTPAIVTPHPQGKPFTTWVTRITQDLETLLGGSSRQETFASPIGTCETSGINSSQRR